MNPVTSLKRFVILFLLRKLLHCVVAVIRAQGAARQGGPGRRPHDGQRGVADSRGLFEHAM